LNHDYIRDWVVHGKQRHTDILDSIINTDQTSWADGDLVSANTDGSLVLVIQLCLTFLSLQPSHCNNNVSHFDMSQREAYTDHGKQPVFVGAWKQDINVRWLLHTVNFFKLHLKASGGEGVLAQQYEELELEQMPQPWLGRIKEGTQPIGSHWKSAYSKLSLYDSTVTDADQNLAFMKDHKTLLNLRIGYDEEPSVDDGEIFSVSRLLPRF
jgi:hypothetical protein